jgi:hypothetical protein
MLPPTFPVNDKVTFGKLIVKNIGVQKKNKTHAPILPPENKEHKLNITG